MSTCDVILAAHTRS